MCLLKQYCTHVALKTPKERFVSSGRNQEKKTTMNSSAHVNDEVERVNVEAVEATEAAFTQSRTVVTI